MVVISALINKNENGRILLTEAFESENLDEDLLGIVYTCINLAWVNLAQ